MAGDPTHICHAREDVALTVVEDVLMRHRCKKQVPGRRMGDAFGFAGGTRGIQQEQNVFAVYWHGWAIRTAGGDGLMPPNVAAFAHGDGAAGAAMHDHGADIRAVSEGCIGGAFKRHRLRSAQTFVGSDQHPAIRIEDAITHRLSAEAAEDHAVDRANTGTGQHRHRCLGNHRQVDRDAVALFDAPALEDIG